MKIADELSVRSAQVEATAKLIEEGSTVPFIARYRKEVTGNLDEVQVIAIRDRLDQLKQLDERRAAILKSLEENNHLTPELEKAVKEAEVLSKLEDIYLPYRPKRKTRGMKAKEMGLEPLAMLILEQGDFDVQAEAQKYIDVEKGVEKAEDAIAGAKDIIAEIINEDIEVREEMRSFFEEKAFIVSKVVKGKEEDKDAAKYRDYFEWSELALNSPSHRVLAIRRGTEEGYLSYEIQPDEEEASQILLQKYIKADNEAATLVDEAARDCYKRLLSMSMETEIRSLIKKRADEKAITVFADNLRNLLLASPMGQKTTLGVDPGMRTGCKLVVLDAQGKLLCNDVIKPIAPYFHVEESEAIIEKMVYKYGIEAVAVGNGTGGRESLDFCKKLPCLKNCIVAMVNESGASVYSASEIARKEFPDYDLTVRGAVSIGRRLMDPLAELVKIDPKAIGVGQYQHDVDQKMLKSSLDDVVVSCVNAVGVDVNTASFKLLSYVAGLSERIAERIVKHREVYGPFKARDEIKTVTGVGPKVYEQAAGFLRIPGAANPLDASAVHPESYGIVEKMASNLNCSIVELMQTASVRNQIKIKEYVTDTVGLLTLEDIMGELDKPGRDPREEFDLFSFTDGVNEMKDLKVGMMLPGVVTNVTAFGAFVDVGVHQDGLVHISALSDSFVSDPAQVVKVNQKVMVRVTEVDLDRKRIALSMKSEEATGDGQKKSLTHAEKGAIKVKVATASTGAKVVVKKAGAGSTSNAASLRNNDNRNGGNRDRNDNRNGGNRNNYSAPENDTYNPFAAFFNKK